jgi:hypothetical protein
MADTSSVACPSCAKRYQWRPETAGKRTVCKACGAAFRLPAAAGQPATLVNEVAHSKTESALNADSYDLSEPATAPAHGSPPPPARPAIDTRPIEVDADARPARRSGYGPLRIAGMISSGLLLLAGTANILMGNCCMAVVGLAMGVYDLQLLLRNALHGSDRLTAIIVNVIAFGAGLVGFALVPLTRDAARMQLVQLSAEAAAKLEKAVVFNGYAVASTLVLAGVTCLLAAIAFPGETRGRGR